MRTTAIKITPEDYILSILTPEDRLDAAFRVADRPDGAAVSLFYALNFSA